MPKGKKDLKTQNTSKNSIRGVGSSCSGAHTRGSPVAGPVELPTEAHTHGSPVAGPVEMPTGAHIHGSLVAGPLKKMPHIHQLSISKLSEMAGWGGIG